MEDYNKLWGKLSSDISANLRFAKLVAQEEPINSNYFFGEYSYPILKWIAISVYSNSPVDDVIPLIISQYYYFVANPFESSHAQYYQLNSYKGLNNLKLDNWLKRNGKQYFVKQVQKERKQNNHTTELLDFIDYSTLLSLDCEVEELSDEEILNRKCLKTAWEILSDKDKDVLHLLVQQKCYWEDAYKELNQYIFPKEGREVMDSWSNKRKQDALALMKARAIEHLIVRFNKVKSELR